MFGRSFLLSTFIVAAILVSTLHATKCNNFQLKNGVKSAQNGKSEEDCSGCTGYICKVDGKTLVGSACTEDVKEICQQSWDDSKIQEVAKNEEGGYYAFDDKYFVHSCQDDNCNTVHWLKDNLVKHNKVISTAGLSSPQKLSHRKKRQDIPEMNVKPGDASAALPDGTKVEAKAGPLGASAGQVSVKEDNGVENVGYGIGLMIASIFAHLFLH